MNSADYDAVESTHEQYQDTDPHAPYYDGPDVPDALDPALCCHGCGAFQSRANIARAGYVKQPLPPADMCHNGHPFVPGIDIDHPDEPHDDWCNSCGEARVTPPAERDASE